MNNWENIEQEIKVQMDTQKVTPPTFVWNAIEEKLDKKPKDRGLIFFWGAGTLAILFLAGIFLFQKSDSNYAVDLGLDNSIEENVIEQNINSTSQLSEKSKAVLSKKEGSIDKLIDDKVTTQKKVSVDKKLRVDVFKVKKSSVKKNVINIQDEVKMGKQSRSSSRATFNNSIATQNTNSNSQGVSKIIAPDVQLKQEKVVTKNIMHIASIGLIDHSLKAKREEVLLSDKVECPSFKKGPGKVPFFEINGLPGRQLKSLRGAGEMVDARTDSESPWYSWGGNALIGLNFSRNFYAATGIEYAQSKEKFTHSSTALTKMIITFDPSTGLPIDTSFVSGRQIDKGEIKYNTIDIPLIAGISKTVKKWEYGIEAGILLNLSFKVQGKILDNKLNVTYVQDHSDLYKDKLGIGLKGSLFLRRFIGKDLSVHIKPSYKQYLNNVNHHSNNMQTTLRLPRVEIGLRKDF